MKIIFVLECAGLMTNGTTASCIRFANELSKKGHEIIVLGCNYSNKPTDNYVILENYNVPFFDGLIHKEGFQFVKVNDNILYETIKGSDVVHFFLPFKLAKHAFLIAEGLNIPTTGAFHLQPDSITSAIHIKSKFINKRIYKGFNKYIYKYIGLIHTPSAMIKNKLVEYGYKNDLRVISNGISDFWHRVDASKPCEYKDKFIVTMVGRLADEKRQDLLIKAVSKSKYEKNIQLILCGKGPNEKKYRKMFKKYKFTNEPQIKFMSQEDLRYFLSYVDLYVHCSDAEIEGLSCVEAFTCGAVPVISDSPLSATKDFALCNESIFEHGNYKSLSNRIDYWYENQNLISSYSEKYINLSKEYAIPIQVEKFEEFFADAKRSYAIHCLPKKLEKEKKKIFKRLNKDIL